MRKALIVQGNPTTTGGLSFDTTFDEQVRAIAPGMNEGYPYFILTSDGQSRMGRTDSSRVLSRIATDGADEYIIFWGDEVLARQGGTE